MKRTGVPRTKVYIKPESVQRVLDIFAFWRDRFTAWNGTCPIVQGFSPPAPAQVIGRVDVSSSWGCGGFAFCPDTSTVHAFVHEWTGLRGTPARTTGGSPSLPRHGREETCFH
jgi:hypothetical protein